MFIINYPCYECGEILKVAYIENNDGEDWFESRGGSHISASDFTATEIKIAGYYNVIINSSYSNKVKSRYNACCCKHCKAFIGNYYIFTDIFVPAMSGTFDYIEVNLENLPPELEHFENDLKNEYKKLLTESTN